MSVNSTNKKYGDTNKHYPNVSFVIPAYNSSQTIRHSINSIFEGNIQEGDEIIIVEDCSTDDTLLVLKELKNQYPIIKILENLTNKGAPASRNIGISETKYDYIFNLDSDDILFPGSRFDLERCLIENKVDVVVFGQSRFFQTNINEITHSWIFKPGIMGLNDFLANNKIPGQNCLYTKESWYRIGKYWEYDMGLLEDWGFFLKQIVHGSKIYVLPNKFYYHRYGWKSLFVRESSKGENMGCKMATRMIEPYLDLLEPKDASYIRSEEGRYTWFINLYKHPVKVKGMPIGQRHRVKYNYFLIIKIYLTKFFTSLKKELL